MGIPRWAVLGVLATALALTPSSAEAALRSVTVADGIDNQDATPSLTFQPVTIEVVSAHVDYDDSGTASVSVTYNMPQASGGIVSIYLNGAKTCLDSLAADGDRVPQIRLTLSTLATYSGYQPQPGPPTSYATLHGYDDRIEAPTQISDDRKTLSASFSNAAFARRDYRCVDGLDGTDGGRKDQFFSYFAGLEPQTMTTPDVTKVVQAELATRYGEKWTSGQGKWLRCPEEEMIEGNPSQDIEPWGLCSFRFRDGAKWRHGSISLKLVDGYLAVDYFGSGTFTQNLKICHIRRNLRSYDPQVLDRRLRADGFVSCQDNSASMIRDLHYLKTGVRRVGFHGTNHAGFEDADVFRCRIAGHHGRYTATCANKLGDRFIYSYTLHKKPKPKPKPRRKTGGSNCDTNYSGACLKPNVSDYDCAGGSGNGPYYVEGPITVVGDDHYDLDSDNDGRACE